jgi:hypothetical protein
MYLPAISIGYAVPDGDFHASVHSSFQSALNLRLEDGIGLLTLVGSSEGDLPQGIRINTPEGLSFEGFQNGELVICREGVLHFENSSLTVQLKGARRWKCDLSALDLDPTKPAVSAAWTGAWGALNQRQKRKGAEIVAGDLFDLNTSGRAGLARRVGRAMRDLFHATQRLDLPDASAVDSLIGLGPGLTPSGDDLLVGYMAGLGCTTRHIAERRRFISNLGKTIVDLSEHTNDISRTYLYHAAQGQVSSRLADLAEAICRGTQPKEIVEIAEIAMMVGHTSGMETVTGLLLGLTTWEGNQLLGQ